MMRTILMALLIFMTNAAQGADPKITGMYSNMRLGTEDVTGVEIFISLAEKNYFAVVQCAEGAISRPVVVPIVVTGASVEFDLPKEDNTSLYVCPSGKFMGKISENGMLGYFEGSQWPGFLKRGKSYWQ